ncbi:hypothetical protein QYE76_071140 [Lolium multiflorum]|uniref:CCHC-type domain-containing protein n=1 Tax=Lolium multiflorum TaxID=4521 RepID=A0AAD8SJ71_LOLMU|nr:hypothetical protein QYE76_071140 [Lolium multiflorum]
MERSRDAIGGEGDPAPPEPTRGGEPIQQPPPPPPVNHLQPLVQQPQSPPAAGGGSTIPALAGRPIHNPTAWCAAPAGRVHPPPPAAPACGSATSEGSLSRGGGAAVSRCVRAPARFGPGKTFQDYVAAKFSSFLSFSPSTPWISGELWVTPPFSSPCFDERSLGSILSFFFCGDGDHLQARCVCSGVFHVVVASPAVAAFLLRAGSVHCARVPLAFHSSLAGACAVAADLSDRAPPVSLSRSKHGQPPPALIDVTPPVPSPFKEAASAPASLPPYSGSPRHAHALSNLEPNAAVRIAPVSPAANQLGEINAPASPPPRSYLDVASCAPAASPKTPPPPFKTLSLDGCFRCLSTLHQIRSCRDPIRCRGCGRSGHRRRECTMPFPQPTFVPTATSPRVAPAARRRPPTPYPSALAPPAPRRARSSSPPRSMGSLFEVGESSSSAPVQVPLPAVERVVPMLEPPRRVPAVSPGPLASDEEEVESDEGSDAPLMEVFMPAGDMDAARRMAMVYIDSLAPFASPAGAIAEAIYSELPGLYVTLVPSSIGDMYAKFLSVEDRELAINHQPFHLHGASIRLVREEEADRVPCAMDWVALVLACRVPVEHLSHRNVAAAFSQFGETLEVDAACLSSTDYAIVRAVVRLKHDQFVPSEILLTRMP